MLQFLNMKYAVAALLALFSLSACGTAPKPAPPGQAAVVAAEDATCSGSDSYCNACKNCKYCKHCSKEGGTCKVCK